MPENKVLSWSVALQKGFQPGSYPYAPERVPLGEVTAVLDYKIWAKKAVGISCYFTEMGTGRKFQLSVYCRFPTGIYTVEGSGIDFAKCPTGCPYQLTIGRHFSGRTVLEKVKPV